MTAYIPAADPMPICGDDLPLTDKQQRLMALARQLGRDQFAPRAAQLDRDAQFPFANYDDLRSSGLLALCVPEAHGGQGAGGLAVLLLLLAVLVAPERPQVQEAICQRHNGVEACRVW